MAILLWSSHSTKGPFQELTEFDRGFQYIERISMRLDDHGVPEQLAGIRRREENSGVNVAQPERAFYPRERETAG